MNERELQLQEKQSGAVAANPGVAGTMRKVVLKVKNLHTYFFTKYGTVMAAQGVSFDLYEGEILGLVGESGSGKSVTVSSIMRLVPSPPGQILAGEVLLDDTDLLQLTDQEMRAHRGRDISMILQDPLSSLNPVYTIGDQVAEPIRLHQGLGGESLRSRVVSLLSRVRVPTPERRIHDYPHQFSGGMRQRVMAAIAMASAPRVLIADEPTTALDVTIQIQFLQLLRDLQAETGMSVIYITHDLGVVAEICDRVAVMYAGRVVEVGTVERIFGQPAHPYTEALIASVPTIGDEREVLKTIEGQPPDLSRPIPGCPFVPRCEYAMPVCSQEYPPAFAVGENEFAHCWRLAEAG